MSLRPVTGVLPDLVALFQRVLPRRFLAIAVVSIEGCTNRETGQSRQ